MNRLSHPLVSYLAIFAFLILAASCKDEKNYDTLISGTVRDFYTNETISNVGIHILEQGIVPSKELIQMLDALKPYCWVHTVNTDTNGNFTVSFNDLESDYCRVIAYNDTFISKECYDIQIGTATDTIVYVQRLKPLQIHAWNQQNIYNRLNLGLYVDSDSDIYNVNLAHTLGGSYSVFGYDADTVIFHRVLSGGQTLLYYSLFRDSQHRDEYQVDLDIDITTDTVKFDLFY
jgi:hypothetical protein